MTRPRHSITWKKAWPVALAPAFALYAILSWNHYGLGAAGRAGNVAPAGRRWPPRAPMAAGRRMQLPAWARAQPQRVSALG
jgi:hypothetical protein